MTDDDNQDRTQKLVNEVIDRLNREVKEGGHPANVMTGLQLIVAQVLATWRIPAEVFFARVEASLEVGFDVDEVPR